MTDLPPVNSAPFLNLPPGTVRLVAPPKVRKRRGVYETTWTFGVRPGAQRQLAEPPRRAMLPPPRSTHP